jgi:NADH-quinone oxidoreductase subunit D
MPFTLTPDQGFDVDVESLEYLGDEVDALERWVLNFGPQHPATHTTLRIVLQLDGERVVRATPHIGYLHSGFEKLAEHHDYNQYVCTVSRMDYISPIVNDIAWHNAVETLLGIDLTPRCTVVRTILSELGRLQNHLLCVGAAALDLGAFTGFLYGFNEREHIYDIMDFISGQRFHPDWSRVGGAMQDLPDEEVFRRMVRHVGAISTEEAVAWSMTGPNARASGVRRDLRKDEPYLCFRPNWDGQGADPVDFKVAVANDGDCLCRYHVRLEEIKQSCRIIDQLIDRIPAGPMNVEVDAKYNLPKKGDVYGSIEGTIQLFEIFMTNRGWDVPVGEAYGAIESPNGELGFYIVGDGTKCAWRAKTRPPSFIHFQTLPKLLEGHNLGDTVAVLGSLNIIAAELDR